MPPNHFILCHPLFSCPQSFPESESFPISWLFASVGQSIGASASAISPSNEYSGLISFRMNWFYLPAVQRTLKSLLQHHSSNTSILRCSAFFMVQLWKKTIGKNIPLSIQIFASKGINTVHRSYQHYFTFKVAS